MGCREGIDPADFSAGVIDPGDETPDSELIAQDTDAVIDPDNTLWARFIVGVSNINYAADITFRYSTVAGTAVGTGGNPDYVPASSVLVTIPAGESEATIEVQLHAGTPQHTGTKQFTIHLTAATNATITVADATATIDYDALLDTGGGPPPPPPPKPWELERYTGWSDGQAVLSRQFDGCRYDGACTAFAVAAGMSALASKQGLGKWRFNPEKLFDDMGGHNCCSGTCNGEQLDKALKWARATGVQRIDTHPNNIGGVDYSCRPRDVAADHAMFKLSNQTVVIGGGGISKPDLLVALKKAIAENGAVYFASIFYSNWNQCRGTDGFILRPHGNATSGEGHAWVMVGWDNQYLVPANADASFGSLRGTRIGAFRIQSSHASCSNGWGQNGRGWLPYSYLTTTWGGNGPRYRYWRIVWGGAA